MSNLLTVGSQTPVVVPADGYGNQTVQNLGPDTLWYKAGITVSSGSNDGTVASGASLTLTTTTALLAQSSSARIGVADSGSLDEQVAERVLLSAEQTANKGAASGYAALGSDAALAGPGGTPYSNATQRPGLAVERVVQRIMPVATVGGPVPLTAPSTGPSGTTYVCGVVDASHNGIFKSADAATPNTGAAPTWTLVVGPLVIGGTTYTYIQQVLELRSGTLLALVSTAVANATRFIARSADGGATWAIAFTFQAPDGSNRLTSLLGHHSWLQRNAAISNDVFMAEYGDEPTGGVGMRMLRSQDDGQTWAAAHTWNGQQDVSPDIRHIHSIVEDPYSTPASKRLWYGIGDGAGPPADTQASRWGWTEDEFATVTDVVKSDGTTATYVKARVVGIMPTAAAVFVAGDISTSPNLAGIYRWDRATGAVTQVVPPQPNVFYQGVSDGTNIALLGVVTPASAVPVDNEYARLFASADAGVTWTVPLQLHRRQTDETTSIVGNMSRLDANNRFWVNVNNVDTGDASSNQINLLCSLTSRQWDERDTDWEGRFIHAQRVEIKEWSHTGTALAATAQFNWFVADEDMYIDSAFASIAGVALGPSTTNFWGINMNLFTSTTIAAASNGLTLPQATITVTSMPAGIPTSGTITINIPGTGTDTVTYTGISGSTFTGCTGGTHTLATADAVLIQRNWNPVTFLGSNVAVPSNVPVAGIIAAVSRVIPKGDLVQLRCNTTGAPAALDRLQVTLAVRRMPHTRGLRR